jgi:nucleoside recognition membrane protein YjiH
MDNKEIKVTWKGWLSLAILILMISGVFKDSPTPLAALDFSNLTGTFGRIGDAGNFLGRGGTGARDGFLMALNIAPIIILFCGILDVAQAYGALHASGIIFQPILKFLLGVPGIAGLAFVSSFTSVDVGAIMTKELYEENLLTDDERTIFISYQYAGSALITNLIAGGAVLLAIIPVSFGFMFVIHMIAKIIGANIVRLILKLTKNKMEVINESAKYNHG